MLNDIILIIGNNYNYSSLFCRSKNDKLMCKTKNTESKPFTRPIVARADYVYISSEEDRRVLPLLAEKQVVEIYNKLAGNRAADMETTTSLLLSGLSTNPAARPTFTT